jgi:hypothetical protein
MCTLEKWRLAMQFQAAVWHGMMPTVAILLMVGPFCCVLAGKSKRNIRLFFGTMQFQVALSRVNASRTRGKVGDSQILLAKEVALVSALDASQATHCVLFSSKHILNLSVLVRHNLESSLHFFRRTLE